MSRYCWEEGAIKLPSDAAAPLKKALRDAANAHHDAVLAACKRFWTDEAKKTRSVKKYREAVEAYRTRLYNGRREPSPVEEATLEVLASIVQPDFRPLHSTEPVKPKTPRQATAADLKWVAPKYTNRDDTFPLGEAAISFKGRVVTWAVPENNHADEHARAHPLAKVFFDHLDRRITWTRGSGGEIVGNDEYNRESRHDGGGANYTVATYPPAKPAIQFRRGSVARW